MGPVTPLLAVVEAWRKLDPAVSFLWVGTPTGPERALVERYEIPFVAIPVARFPRYVSLEWLIAPFAFARAFVQSIRLIQSYQPQLIASAGGFTSVPVALAGWVRFIPIWLHQQDVEPILTSRLLSPLAGLITVAFEQTEQAFSREKTRRIGNPVRPSLFDGSKAEAFRLFDLDETKPTVLVFGGGTGATWVNQAIEQIAPRLKERANVIHLTGKGKATTQTNQRGWYQAAFLYEEMKHAYAVADVVVSRAGMGAITELAALSKASILIPLPHSPQESNVAALGSSVDVVNQSASPETLWQQITAFLDDAVRREQFGQALHAALRTDVAEELVQLLDELGKSKHTP